MAPMLKETNIDSSEHLSDHSESNDISPEEPLDMSSDFRQFMNKFDLSPKKPVRQITVEQPPSLESCLTPEKKNSGSVRTGGEQAPRMPRRSLEKKDISAIRQAKEEIEARFL